MKIPQSGLELITEFEGFRSEAYPDPLHGWAVPTIGYGFTRNVRKGDVITRQEAYARLEEEAVGYLEKLEQRIPYWEEMNEYQQGALLSFAFNVGPNFYGSFGFATITAALRDRAWDKVPAALMLYVNPGTNVEAGLRRRRKAEANLWNMALKLESSETLSRNRFEDMVLHCKPELKHHDEWLDILYRSLSENEKIELVKTWESGNTAPAPPPPKPQLDRLTLTYAGQTFTQPANWRGLKMLRLGFAGAFISVCSGQAASQALRRAEVSRAGSNEPIPQGRWTIGDIEWAAGKDNYNASWNAGLGPVWIGLEYQGRTARSAIGIHLDYNMDIAPGTAGCIGVQSVNDMKKLVSWLRQTDPRLLIVDYGL